MKKQIGFLIALGVFLLDRVSKYWIVDVIDLEKNGAIDLLPFFELRFVENTGISLGLFQMEGDPGRYLLIALTGVVSIIVAVWLWRETTHLVKTGLGLVLGGALGNIWDRFEYGGVADFLHFYLGDWSFYIFNVADAAITIGVLLLLWDALLSPQKKNK
ncbi:MAG: signal peptidase II [Sphingomonadales bacterium]